MMTSLIVTCSGVSYHFWRYAVSGKFLNMPLEYWVSLCEETKSGLLDDAEPLFD